MSTRKKPKSKPITSFDPYIDLSIDDFPPIEQLNSEYFKNIVDFFESLTGSRKNSYVTSAQVKQLMQDFTVKAVHKLPTVFILVLVDFMDSQLSIVIDKNDKSSHYAYI